MGKIQRKKGKRPASMIKKKQQRKATKEKQKVAMLATEQQEKIVMLAIEQQLLQQQKMAILATEQQQQQELEIIMLVRTQLMGTVGKVMLATEQQQENYRMLLEILSRLPVKSLLRFMCVCRNWKTLISSHLFRKLHREKHCSTPPLLITSFDDGKVATPPYNPELYNPKVHIYEPGIHNDTYLVTLDLEGKFFEKVTLPFPSKYFLMKSPSYQSKLLCFSSCDSENSSYLYNPSTRQSFLLTKPSCFSSPEFQKSYGSAFGYIPSKDEYIMVHLVKLSNGKLHCEVLNNISISNDNFKLRINQWRSSIDNVSMRGNILQPGVFVGGAFYWQVLISDDHVYDGFVLSFDAEKERFSTFPYPDEVLDLEARLWSLEDDLYLLDYPETTPILEIWKLSCPDNKLWSPYFNNKIWSRHWKFDFEKLSCFSSVPHRGFRTDLFLYNLKYLKGHEEQPLYEQCSVEMGKLHLQNKLPFFIGVSLHTNLFTL